MKKYHLIFGLVLILACHTVWAEEIGEIVKFAETIRGRSPEELLKELKTANSEKSIELILWRLGEKNLTEEQILEVLPYLRHKNNNILSAAMGIAGKSNNPQVLDEVKAFTSNEDTSKAFRAVTVLFYLHGDNSGIEKLTQKLLDQNSPAEDRRNLALTLFDIGSGDIVEAYLKLLTDPDKWLRYNAYNQLKKAAGQDFGYDYHQPSGASKEAVNKWMDWWQRQPRDFKFKKPVEHTPVAGIGAELGTQDGYPVLMKIMKGFGAEKAGLKIGDIVLEVNGDSAYGKTMAELSLYEFTGKAGTTVKLKAQSAKGDIKQVEITREPFVFKLVNGKMEKADDQIPMYPERPKTSAESKKVTVDIESAGKTYRFGEEILVANTIHNNEDRDIMLTPDITTEYGNYIERGFRVFSTTYMDKEAVPYFMELLRKLANNEMSDESMYLWLNTTLTKITGNSFGQATPFDTSEERAEKARKWLDWWDKNKDAY